MVVGRGLMNIGRISVNPTITTLEITPDDLVCDGYAYFAVTVNRVSMETPNPTGNIRIINVDTGSALIVGDLTDGYVVVNAQLSNGVYNFAALYNGIINSFASSQSETVGYNVNFIMTEVSFEGPTTFRADLGAEYMAYVSIIGVAPVILSTGFVIFTASDGYQITTIDTVSLFEGDAELKIDPGDFVEGSWVLSAQYISDGICYASSDIDYINVLVT